MLRRWILGGAAIASLAVGAAGNALAQTKIRGVELYSAGEYRQAEQELRKTLEAEPQNLRARYYLGLTLLELERNAEAEEELRGARALLAEREEAEPRRDEIDVGLARACMEQKQYDEARAALDQAQQAKPDNPEVFLYRGRLELHRENHAAAVKALERAIELNPKKAYSHYYAGIAYGNLKRPDKMAEHFQYFLRLAPNAPEASKVRSYLKSLR
ncbi:MAG: tetratricopeptide repeat protein [Acidobacteria bacterium]|nr:tetratricopeptide repeat protein [Acidobacteriota bacterium]